MLFSLYWKRLNTAGALAGMVTGAVVSFVWGSVEALSGMIYEMVPGFAAAALVTWIVSSLTRDPSAEVQSDFERASKLAKIAESDPDVDIAEAGRRLEA